MTLRFHARTELFQTEALADTLAHCFDRFGVKHIGMMVDEHVLAQPLMAATMRALEGSYRIDRYPHHALEPTTALVDAYAKALRKNTPELVVGVGGGSTLDLAKAVAVMAVNEGSVEAYHGTGRRLSRGLRKIMVPSTAGTGAEVTPGAVLVNESTRFKRAISGEGVTPEVAVLCAELTLTMPLEVTAATGMDAMGHAVESYTSPAANVITRMYATQALALLARSLPQVLETPNDLGLRADVQLAAALAGCAICNSDTGAAHALSYALGLERDVPHGHAIAWLLPEVVFRNVELGCERYAELLAVVGAAGDDARAFASWLRSFPALAYLGRRFADLGASDEEREALAAAGLQLESALQSNPVPFGLEDAKLVLKRLEAQGRAS